MRVIVVLCLVAVAAAQYEYGPSSQPQAGAAQLSQPIQPVSEYNKEFYTYTGPENEADDGASDQISNSVKKNLRVIFIKAPENTGLENAALQLAKSANEERTAIYVLSKQASVGELANKLNAVQSISNQPEVHFVKYRTPADAENAQRAIQSQYDSLPGASSHHNGGSAPVLNFASKAAVAAPVAAAPIAGVAQAAPALHAAPSNIYISPQQQSQPQPQPQPQPQSYLPPSIRL